MGNSYQEKLSAWADDELCGFEVRRITDEVLKSEAARSRLTHYRLIGAAIRDEPAIALDQSFSDRVMAEIEALPEEEQWDLGVAADAGKSDAERGGVSWVKVLAGAAIAASVALISLTVLKSISSLSTIDQASQQPVASVAPETAAPQQGGAPNAVASLPPSDLAKPVSSPSVVPQAVKPIPPAMEGSANARLLGGYLATHAEHASRRTMLPRARIMGFDMPVDDAP
jgi:negative regulator of sigma E activity